MAGGGFIRLMPDEQPDVFVGGNFPRHLAIDPLNNLDFAGPIFCVMRPAQPGRFMLFPFGGHDKAGFGGLAALAILHCGIKFA